MSNLSSSLDEALGLFCVGALLDEVPKEGEGMKINGSSVIAWASSKEEVIEFLKKDVYAKEGVWDLEKVSLASHNTMEGLMLTKHVIQAQIYPFKCAFREKFP